MHHEPSTHGMCGPDAVETRGLNGSRLIHQMVGLIPCGSQQCAESHIISLLFCAIVF